MDQIKIGRFIAEIRKEHNMTQRQLADALSISDKTISKWECGKGLPDISLMMPLCEVLEITVNDLLTGERVLEAEYKKKAEENMMNLIEENKENKKRMILSVVCAVITIIAECSLGVIAAFIPMPTIARIAILIFALITGAFGIATATVLEVKAGYYECPHCKAIFVPTMGEYVRSYHTFTKRRLKCHECGKTGMCKHRLVK